MLMLLLSHCCAHVAALSSPSSYQHILVAALAALSLLCSHLCNLIAAFLLLPYLTACCCALITMFPLPCSCCCSPVAMLSLPCSCHCNPIAAALAVLPLLHSHQLSSPYSHHCSLIAMLSSSSSLFLFLSVLLPSKLHLFFNSHSHSTFHLIPHHLLAMSLTSCY